MRNIKIDESIEHLVPEELKNLPDAYYRLTKTHSSRLGLVFVGDSVWGPLQIINVLDKPGARVINMAPVRSMNHMEYLRTSPIIEILDTTKTSVTFRTEGGVYRLDRMKKSSKIN